MSRKQWQQEQQAAAASPGDEVVVLFCAFGTRACDIARFLKTAARLAQPAARADPDVKPIIGGP